VIPSHQPTFFAIPIAPDGFQYCERAITEEDERELITRLVKLPLQEFQFHGFEGKRRVVSFGWRYDFSAQRALPAEPIPPFLFELHERVQAAAGFVLPDLEQVLVTEYAPGAPIGWHKDRPVFGQVLGLSLASACDFRFRKKYGARWERMTMKLAPRSAYLLDGPARWEWEHSIPPVPSLRYSITFRNRRVSRSGP
jgi:alkylated DNA repair dioxygenase AlkB